MIDYEAIFKDMDLRYAELSADLKTVESDLYRTCGELRQMRENPQRCEIENVELRRQLFDERIRRGARETAIEVLWQDRALYAAKMFWTMMGYLKGEILFQQLPTWVRKNLFPENRRMVGGQCDWKV